MKNIYVLPTDKPSRLVKIYNDVNREKFTLKINGEVNDSFKEYVNIYITNDEEIKEGNWFIHPFNTIHKAGGNLIDNDYKKIILTDNPDLIKDGVQAIDDEFLEWFVKNSSCEAIETKLVEFEVDMGLGESCIEYGNYYKIIIPKEEPKKETIEEVAEKESEYLADWEDKDMYKKGFIDGAKWQQQQNKNLYSEEEVRLLINRLLEFISHHDIKEWVEWIEKQFKKK